MIIEMYFEKNTWDQFDEYLKETRTMSGKKKQHKFAAYVPLVTY